MKANNEVSSEHKMISGGAIVESADMKFAFAISLEILLLNLVDEKNGR